MAAEVFACPECQARLRYSSNLKPGAKVRCPKCRTQFPVPNSAPRADPAMPPEQAYTDAPGPRRPRFSEPAAEDISPNRRPAGRKVEPNKDYPDRPFSGEYSIDIGRWFSLAKQHYGAILGPAIGFMLLAAIMCAIPYFVVIEGAPFVALRGAARHLLLSIIILDVLTQGGMLFLVAVVFFPLWSGFTAVCLAQLKGRPWTFGDFFSGYRHFGPLAGVGFASQLLALVFIAWPNTVITLAAIQTHNLQRAEEAVGLMTLLGLMPLIFFQVRLVLFAPALVLERNLSAIDAMKANWQLTRGHFWGLFGVSLLLALISVGGALMCLIGLLFAAPYTLLVLNAGYLLITDSRDLADNRLRHDA